MPEAPVRSNSPNERKESNTNSKYPESQHASQSTASKDNSELQMCLHLNSPNKSQSKDQTELSTISKCKLAHATLRNIIAWGKVLPSVPGQLVHGDTLQDDCVRVTVEESLFANPIHPSKNNRGCCKIYPDEHNADPKTMLSSTFLLQNQPLSEPDEHDADTMTKKRKKKKLSDTKSGELKSRRSSKRLKTAA
ncbi:hypothetical protein MKW98_019296 [Papaver atlanticum]|uniref:Uncharacterized protein n=1 Tax=Papaver atlanticum TaxID=357466 RepID=A0AAD4SLB7_9MAGN|nr:hypothetical protein MKW98_019296 [Papaver atlanticum]